MINQACTQRLLEIGAKWGEGPKTRGAAPQFVSKRICPIHHSSHCAATKRSSRLFRLLHRLDELWIWRTRGFRPDQDCFIFRRSVTEVMGFLPLDMPLPGRMLMRSPWPGSYSNHKVLGPKCKFLNGQDPTICRAGFLLHL